MSDIELKAAVVKLANENPDGIRKHLVPILKTAIFKYDGSPIRKPKLVRAVNKTIGNVSRGFFTDEHWRGPKKVWDALSVMGLDWDIMGSSYNGTMPPESKTWKFEIKFTNERGKPAKLYGHLVASGAGSVDDPLSRYDIVTYVS